MAVDNGLELFLDWCYFWTGAIFSACASAPKLASAYLWRPGTSFLGGALFGSESLSSGRRSETILRYMVPAGTRGHGRGRRHAHVDLARWIWRQCAARGVVQGRSSRVVREGVWGSPYLVRARRGRRIRAQARTAAATLRALASNPSWGRTSQRRNAFAPM